MNDKRLSDKERALLEATRREIEAKTTRSERVDTTGLAPSASRQGSRAAVREPRAAVSPLDAPTVLGWDHPAAQSAPKSVEDKWARIAALMETERREADARRRRLRRRGIALAALVFFVALIALARALVR